MDPAQKKPLSKRDICTKFITPALVQRADWGTRTQFREEVPITGGRVIVRGKFVTRGRCRPAGYVLYHKPNILNAVIEAKDNRHSVGNGMQRLCSDLCGYGEMGPLKILMAIPIAVPPCPEQHRGIANVDQLVALLDTVETKLTRARELSEKIMEDTVRSFADRACKPKSVAIARTSGGVGTAYRRRPGTALVDGGRTTSAGAFSAPSGSQRARANITAALGLSNADWIWATRQLKDAERVVQTGQRRGARHHVAGEAVALATKEARP